MKRIALLVLILCLFLINCSMAEENDTSVAFWVERITFTEVEWNTEAGSCMVSSDWISMPRFELTDAVIRKNGWFYEIITTVGSGGNKRVLFYWVKENPLDYLR